MRSNSEKEVGTMPACARREIVAKAEVGVYHCWNRCVQRAFLCGRDPVTGVDFEYRRDWIEQTEQVLAGLFAIEVSHHAEQANHIHLILRTRPDVAQQWNDEEVVRRWLIIAKLKRNGSAEIQEPTAAQVARQLKNPRRVRQLRRRLANVSWFMGTLCENISRRCNEDSGTKGTFWEHRFKCRNLASEAAILICGIYVDLNAIRAGEAQTPEESRHTSAYNRIQGLKWRRCRGKRAMTHTFAPDAWLCELTLQEQPQGGSVPCHARPPRASDKGLLQMSVEKYLEFLDWTGRQVRSDKRGSIPQSLAPILDRLGINGELWVEAVYSFDEWFGHVVGSASTVTEAARRVGRRWFGGKTQCAAVFG
jgi:hypothetical protein